MSHHTAISFVKSAVRIIGYMTLMAISTKFFPVVMILADAEIIGILEEL